MCCVSRSQVGMLRGHEVEKVEEVEDEDEDEDEAPDNYQWLGSQ